MCFLEKEPLRKSCMQKWTAFLLSGAFVAAFVVGLFITPLDSQANTGTFWRAEFYNNPSLEGNPVLVRNDRDLVFNWSDLAPAPNIAFDNFSARWLASFYFEAGEWVFSAGADDGVRLWVDDSLLIDQWSPSGTFVVHTGTTALERGRHEVRVEYYDAQGLAGISVNWKPAATALADSQAEGQPPAPALPQTNPTQIPAGTPLAHVATGVLNVRTGPGIQFERIDQIFLYQRFPILGQNEDGSWYLIDLKDGRTGWVAARFIYRTGSNTIAVVPTPQPSDPLVVFGGVEALPLERLNLRPTPNLNNERLAVIPVEVTIIVKGRSNDSIWYFVQFGELEGWVFAPLVNLQGFPVYDLPFVE
jgi:uncharacterized protein YraI